MEILIIVLSNKSHGVHQPPRGGARSKGSQPIGCTVTARSVATVIESFQPLNLSTSQPLNLSTSQPLNLSTSQPFNLSMGSYFFWALTVYCYSSLSRKIAHGWCILPMGGASRSMPKREVGTRNVSVFIYERAPMFAVCTQALLVSTGHYTQQLWFAATYVRLSCL